jgi:hypothetical protein
MEIEKPTWQTKQICPDCGQGNPTFCYCTKCGFVTLMCEETGDTFKNPRNLEDGFIDKCPSCGEDSSDFVTADSDRILDSGFTKDDYE